MEDSMAIQDRLLCVKCLQSNRTIVKILGIDQVKDMIEEKFHQIRLQNKINLTSDLLIIKEFKQRMINLQTQMMKYFEEIQVITQQWINQYEKIEDETFLMSFFQGLELLNCIHQNDKQFNQKINKSYFLKLSLKLKHIINSFDVKARYDFLSQLFFKSEVVSQIQQITQISQNVNHLPPLTQQIEVEQDDQQIINSIQLIDSVQQGQWSFAIAFNNNGSQMVSGCDQNIQVWKFVKGKMRLKNRLLGHTQNVLCLIYSKRLNWFASGSEDRKIICWKEQQNGEWKSSLPQYGHTDRITCLLLNNNEDELISCSNDQQIKVWKVNCLIAYLDYMYTLVKKHTDWVYCISLNQSETYLVSCSEDKKIILWYKQEKKWKYLNEIINEDFGYRICFISDNEIVWQQHGIGITHFFEIRNWLMVRRPELNIELNQESDTHDSFPTIFNKNKQIIVQSHNRFVYLLKKQEKKKYTLICDPIDCIYLDNYGSLTDDGEFLVVWNAGTRMFRVYQIQYK